MNKRIHIGWVVALFAVVIAGQGFGQLYGQPKAEPVGTYQIAANDNFLFAMNSSTGKVWKHALTQPDSLRFSMMWEKVHIKHLGN